MKMLKAIGETILGGMMLTAPLALIFVMCIMWYGKVG